MKKKILVVLLILIAVVLWWWMRLPNEGKIENRKIVEKVVVSEWQKYEGRSFGFEYPPALKVGESEEKKAILRGSGGNTAQLVVLEKEFGNSLMELADYKMRQVKNELYENFSIDEVKCFSKIDAWERVCWKELGNGRLVSVAMTASTNDKDMEADFQRIVRSVEVR